MNEIPKSVADHQQLLRTAFDAYLEQLNRGGLEPSEGPLPYDFEEEVNARQWPFDNGMAKYNDRGIINHMVKSELRELTDGLNRWSESLQRWCAWNKVIQPFNTDKIKAWGLRREFLESLVFYCLFQPASIRDRFTFVVTNAMHQVRLMAEEDYQDYLQGDPKKPGDKQRGVKLRRSEKEKCLSKLISIWPEGKKFMVSLEVVNDKEYENETSNYRNLHSHIIGPRLGLGHVQAVVRFVREQMTLVKQPDDTYIEKATGMMLASYKFGKGISPLDLEKAHAANLEQYRRARKCYESYRKLLAVGMEAMPLAKQSQIEQAKECADGKIT